MKKALPIVLVLAALTAAILLFLKRRSSTYDMPTGIAAQLAPAETILLLEIPDVERTRKRWSETSLYKISQEPEWQQFTANWDAFVKENDIAREAMGVIGEIEKADPAGLFFALTSVDSPAPKIVGGFPYRGRKSDVEAVFRKLKNQILKSFPAAKSEISSYEGVEIETLQDREMTAAFAFRDNWFFFASDTEVMLKMLGRYLKKPGATPALHGDPLWKSTADQGTKDADLTLWGRWSVIQEKLNAFSTMAGPGAAAPTNTPNPIEAAIYTWKLDGPLMRDRVFMKARQTPKEPAFANRLAAFTNPATFFYLGYDFGAAEQYAEGTVQAMASLGLTKEVNDLLSPKGLKIEDVFKTFGPEISLQSTWEEGGLALPDLLAVVEVKDKTKARLFAEIIGPLIVDDTNAAPRVEGATSFWAGKTSVPLFRPTFAINDTHMFFGLNQNAVTSGIKQATEKGPNVLTAPGSPLPAGLKTVPPPTAMLMYLDAKTLFERVYEKVKPMAAFSLVGNPEVGKHFDAAKLPQATTISRHLAPVVLTAGVEKDGWVVEATGSVSFIGTYVFAIPAALFGTRMQMSPPPTPAPAAAAPVSPAPGTPAPAPGE